MGEHRAEQAAGMALHGWPQARVNLCHRVNPQRLRYFNRACGLVYEHLAEATRIQCGESVDADLDDQMMAVILALKNQA